jgi:4-amino-4-deoxy-L-arabinose transferase-like glycosyltransferase
MSRLAAAGALLLSCYAGLALAYRNSIPLFEGPDEPSHLHYAAFVYEHGRLPREQPDEVPGEGMQSPLTYLLAAPLVGWTGLDVPAVARALHEVDSYLYGFDFSSPGGPGIAFAPNGSRIFRADGSLGALSRVRAASLVFGLVAVLLTFAAAARLRGDAPLAGLAGALLAFDPQFLFVSGYFTNDPAAAAAGAAALLVVVSAVARGPARRHYVAGGAVSALGILAKTSAVPGLAVAAVTLVAIDRRAARARWLDAAVAAGVALLVAGPYLVWAAVHRGGVLGVGAVYASASQLHVPEGQLLGHLTWWYWIWTFQSYWCRFGWMNVAAPAFVYAVFFAIAAAGVAGCAFAGRIRAEDPPPPQSLRAYLFASVAATVAAHLALNATVVSAQGRQLFATAPQLALLIALGIDRIAPGERWRLPAALLVVTALVALDLYCLRSVLSAAYGS